MEHLIENILERKIVIISSIVFLYLKYQRGGVYTFSQCISLQVYYVPFHEMRQSVRLDTASIIDPHYRDP